MQHTDSPDCQGKQPKQTSKKHAKQRPCTQMPDYQRQTKTHVQCTTHRTSGRAQRTKGVMLRDWDPKSTHIFVDRFQYKAMSLSLLDLYALLQVKAAKEQTVSCVLMHLPSSHSSESAYRENVSYIMLIIMIFIPKSWPNLHILLMAIKLEICVQYQGSDLRFYFTSQCSIPEEKSVFQMGHA